MCSLCVWSLLGSGVLVIDAHRSTCAELIMDNSNAFC